MNIYLYHQLMVYMFGCVYISAKNLECLEALLHQLHSFVVLSAIISHFT